jgi:hypothetical protein
MGEAALALPFTAAVSPLPATPLACDARDRAEAALLAELALTFDLEALVAEAQRDPFGC